LVAKPNANTASRDELLDAGVRADIVDEIMKRRRRKGGITLEALGEVKGVGPATLEQLGKALDFKQPSNDKAKGIDKPRRSPKGRPASGRRGGRDDQAVQKAAEQVEPVTDAADAILRAGTEQAADLAAAAVQGAAEAARGTVEAEVQTAGQGTHATRQAVEQTTEAAEDAQHEAVQRSAQDASAFGRVLLEFLQEQGRENMAALEALARARGLDEAVRVQGEYLRGATERMTELNRRWLELAGTMWPAVQIGDDRGGQDEDSSTAR
jgi:hypothetical protein